MATPETAGASNVYEPCEDSFLFLDLLEGEELEATTVLEIGSGSGVVSAFARTRLPNAIFWASDISRAACEISEKTWRLNHKGSLDVLNASLSPLRPNSVDLLLFNPPYVPSEDLPPHPSEKGDDKWIYLALDGGQDGMEVTWVLLDNLDSILAPNGVAYILFCARNKPLEVRQKMETRGWQVQERIKRRAGWEVLCILRFQRAKEQSSA